MYVKHLLLCCLMICLVHGQSTTNSSDQDSFIDLKSNRPVNIEEACKKVPCLVKCCPMNHMLLTSKDENYTSTPTCINNPDKYGIESPYDYSNKLVIYNKDIKKKIMETDKKLTDFTFLSHKKFADIMDCCWNMMELAMPPDNVNYLTEDGRLLTSRINYFDNWMSEMNTGQFCFENEVIMINGTLQSTSPEIALYGVATLVTDPINQRAKVSAYGMLVSCGFMVLVLAVYSVLTELRNLAGLMLMAYVATLTVAFLFRAIQVFANDNDLLDTTGCIVVGLLFLYALLASFTWMNVMSFDIWWSMRGFRKSRRINKRGIPVKFAWYCLYGWGVPMIPMLFIIIVEQLDLSHLPDFVKPHILTNPDECFLPEEERQLYLNAPIAIATFINLVLFVMTAYNIWRIKSGVRNNADSKRNKKDETRFGIYLKLSMVMGISWILEVLSSVFYPDSGAWYIIDIYNTLIGLFIFIIFVCKRNILKSLCRRFEIENKFVKNWDRDASSTKTHTWKGKRNVADSLTDNSDVADISATDQFRGVKCSLDH